MLFNKASQHHPPFSVMLGPSERFDNALKRVMGSNLTLFLFQSLEKLMLYEDKFFGYIRLQKGVPESTPFVAL